MSIETRKEPEKILTALRHADTLRWSRSYKFDAAGGPIKINTLRFLAAEGISKCQRKAAWFSGRAVLLAE